MSYFFFVAESAWGQMNLDQDLSLFQGCRKEEASNARECIFKKTHVSIEENKRVYIIMPDLFFYLGQTRRWHLFHPSTYCSLPLFPTPYILSPSLSLSIYIRCHPDDCFPERRREGTSAAKDQKMSRLDRDVGVGRDAPEQG